MIQESFSVFFSMDRSWKVNVLTLGVADICTSMVVNYDYNEAKCSCKSNYICHILIFQIILQCSHFIDNFANMRRNFSIFQKSRILIERMIIMQFLNFKNPNSQCWCKTI